LADEILIQSRHGSYLTQSIEAVAAESAQTRHLGGDIGAPLLKEIDTMYLASGAACGLLVSYYRNDLFRLVSTIRLQVPSEEVLQ